MDDQLREAVEKARRDHVLKAAVKVFGEKGFRGASIRDLAREAGVADGTIYNIFESKLDILLAILDPLSERTLQEPTGTSSVSVVPGDMLKRRLDTFRGDTLTMMRILLSEALVDTEIRTQFLEVLISPMLHPVTPRPTAKSTNKAYALTATMLGLILLRLLGGSEPKSEDATLALLASLLGPIPPAGASI